MDKHKTTKIIVSGKVIGVGFRSFVKHLAINKYQIKGYVQNMEDRTVVIIAHGENKNIEKFIDDINIGPIDGRVDDLIIEEFYTEEVFEKFEFKYFQEN